MMQVVRRVWLRDLLVGICLLTAMVGMLMSPREISAAARQGVELCLNVIIPSLFPFFVLSTLIIELGLARYVGRALEGVMRPLFRVSGPCSTAVALGFLGGYPVGAKAAISLYEKGLCSKVEAERLLAFCNNSGPAFILGAVGAGILGSSRAGWILYLTHTAASLTVGLIFRFYKYKSPPSRASREQTGAVVRLTDSFIHSVKSSMQSMFGICSFVIFFTVIIRLLYISGVLPGIAGALAGIFGVSEASAANLLTGLIEMTSGLFALEGGATQLLTGKMAMAAFMLGWAGLSVHCQVLSFVGKSGLSPWTYISGKLLHGIISAVYTAAVMQIMNMREPVGAYLAEQVESLAQMSFLGTLEMSLKVVLGIGIAYMLAVLVLAARKGRGGPLPRRRDAAARTK